MWCSEYVLMCLDTNTDLSCSLNNVSTTAVGSSSQGCPLCSLKKIVRERTCRRGIASAIEQFRERGYWGVLSDEIGGWFLQNDRFDLIHGLEMLAPGEQRSSCTVNADPAMIDCMG
jgi:predicted RNA-binding Zn-ribbon protein involved in translation (DUF1610 family)